MKVIRKGDEKEKIKRDMGIVECGWCNKEFSKEDIRLWLPIQSLFSML